MERKVIVNQIMAMDGTIIQSHYRHDYKVYECELEGVKYTCSVDGGTDYLKRSGKFTEMSIYDDAPFEVIRMFLCRGGRGQDRIFPITYTPLCAINDKWLDALIHYETELRPDNPYLQYYIKEKEFRNEL